MGPDLAETSSISASLEQLNQRVTSMADAAAGAKQDDVAADLYAVERALAGAVRRLERMVSGRPGAGRR